MTAIRVAVADDQHVICSGFAALLGAQPGLEVVGTASNGIELVELVEAARPDVALVDVRMPLMDGIEATRRVVGAHATKVLILTTFDLDRYVYDALRAGASGFLLKDVTGDRLVEAVRLVADGAMLLGPNVTRRLVADFTKAAPAPVDLTSTGLTPRETEVLLKVAAGLSNAEIAGALHLGVETVKSHVGEIVRRLSLRDRVQVVVYAYESGLVGDLAGG